MTKTRTEKRMKIEVGGDKSQDKINGKVNSESDYNLNSVDDDGANIRFEKAVKLVKGSLKEKEVMRKKSMMRMLSFNTPKVQSGIMIQIQIVIWFLFGWILIKAHWTLVCIDLLKIFHLKSHLQNIYELTFIKYLGNDT